LVRRGDLAVGDEGGKAVYLLSASTSLVSENQRKSDIQWAAAGSMQSAVTAARMVRKDFMLVQMDGISDCTSWIRRGVYIH
jgi:hypothetical protein